MKKIRSDSLAALEEAWANAAKKPATLPKTLKLKPADKKLALELVHSRARGEWNAAELRMAVELARAFTESETLQAQASQTRAPADQLALHQALALCSARIVRLVQTLRIDYGSRFGTRDNAWRKEQLAVQVRKQVAEQPEGNGLLAGPMQ